MWDGKDSRHFESTVSYKYVEDDYNVDRYVKINNNSEDSIHITSWLKKIATVSSRVRDNIDTILSTSAILKELFFNFR